MRPGCGQRCGASCLLAPLRPREARVNNSRHTRVIYFSKTISLSHYNGYILLYFRLTPLNTERLRADRGGARGIEHDLEENVQAILAQDYRDYEVIFVTESENDPAHGVLARLLKQRRRLSPPTWMVVAGEAKNRGQKVHNLLAALDTLGSIDRRVEALVFADSDMRPPRNWLAELVAPLGDRQVGATTGYRWYLPSNEGGDPAQSFASVLLSVWNSSALALLGERSGFAWGGSTAILRENFDEIGVKERWQGALSDDYVLTSAVHEHGQRIKFVPECLVASRSEVRHHRQSRWLDEWGRLKGDRPYELVFGITAA